MACLTERLAEGPLTGSVLQRPLQHASFTCRSTAFQIPRTLRKATRLYFVRRFVAATFIKTFSSAALSALFFCPSFSHPDQTHDHRFAGSRVQFMNIAQN
jgi:hypothetical protein